MINTVKRVKSNVFDKLKPSSGQMVPNVPSYNSLADSHTVWTDGVDTDAFSVFPVINQVCSCLCYAMFTSSIVCVCEAPAVSFVLSAWSCVAGW